MQDDVEGRKQCDQEWEVKKEAQPVVCEKLFGGAPKELLDATKPHAKTRPVDSFNDRHCASLHRAVSSPSRRVSAGLDGNSYLILGAPRGPMGQRANCQKQQAQTLKTSSLQAAGLSSEH